MPRTALASNQSLSAVDLEQQIQQADIERQGFTNRADVARSTIGILVSVGVLTFATFASLRSSVPLWLTVLGGLSALVCINLFGIGFLFYMNRLNVKLAEVEVRYNTLCRQLVRLQQEEAKPVAAGQRKGSRLFRRSRVAPGAEAL